MRSKASSKASRLSDKMRAKKPDLFIDGDGIYLRHLMEKDLKGRWYDWLNDSVVTRYQNKGIFPNTLQKQRKYFESLQGSSGEVVLAIVEKRTEKHIGNVGLHEIEWVHRHATLCIVIGERVFWGTGYG